MKRKAALVILDGWGLGRKDKSDAIWCANTPFTDSLYSNYAHCRLRTDGLNVGLPEGQMGNSEVGHMNIGAGRIVWQMLVRINKAFEEGTVAEIPKLQEAFEMAKQPGKKLHLIGLVSDGGVHSHQNHLIGLAQLAERAGVSCTYIHAFLDGRDTDPKSGAGYLQTVANSLKDTHAKISSVIGRYYAMDRDNRWERVAKAYHLLTKGVGTYSGSDPVVSVQEQYAAGITDEFMNPIKCLENGEGNIEEGDVVICFNYRTDRGREITMALTQHDYPEQEMKKLNLNYYTMTRYDDEYKINGILFENQNLSNTLGEIIAKNGCTQLRAAETEKYPHVTFFFSGGQEEPFAGEQRLLVNSPKVATYDLQPQMSAPELTEKAIEIIKNSAPDFICLNYANADMVGHTGVYEAIIKAVECVDAQLEKLTSELLTAGYECIVIADHGNSDFAINDDGTPNTAHTTNPVPCWLLSNTRKPTLHNGILADVAPTILQLMGIEQPAEMTGTALFDHETQTA